MGSPTLESECNAMFEFNLKYFHGHRPILVQTVIGSRFWLTRSSMIWGRLDSNMALHSDSKVGEPITEPRVLQVSWLVDLGAAKVEATKAERRRTNFILILVG